MILWIKKKYLSQDLFLSYFQESERTQQVDDLPIIRQLLGRNRLQSDSLALEEDEMDQATGITESRGLQELTKVVQLTGFSDPVYAEAYVDVHQVPIFSFTSSL